MGVVSVACRAGSAAGLGGARADRDRAAGRDLRGVTRERFLRRFQDETYGREVLANTYS